MDARMRWLLALLIVIGTMLLKARPVFSDTLVSDRLANFVCTVEGIGLAKETEPELLRTFGVGVHVTNMGKIAYSERYYVDRRRTMTLHVAFETDTVNLIEVRAGVHLPFGATGHRLRRAISTRLHLNAPVLGGIRLGDTAQSVRRRCGSPTRSTIGRSTPRLYYHKSRASENSTAFEYYAMFEFRHDHLVTVQVYEGEMM